MNHATIIADKLSIAPNRVKAVINLLNDGASIPFIARYRKEATGSLDEVSIAAIRDLDDRLERLDKRRCYILDTIEAAGSLTPELRKAIEDSTDENRLEDLFLPYMPRRRTRGKAARENGLEPLARIIASGHLVDATRQTTPFLSDNVPDSDCAIQGACDIIAEDISQDAATRQRIRNSLERHGHLTCSIPESKRQQADNYLNYDSYDKPLSRVSSHQYLAMARGSQSGLLKLSISADDNAIIRDIARRAIPRSASQLSARLIADSAEDAYKRLARPSIDNSIHTSLKDMADTTAIGLFADNLRQLLMAPPIIPVTIMAIDPGFRTGCKLVILDKSGSLLYNTVIYPNPPANDTTQAAKTVHALISRYEVKAIAVGSATASRETMAFLKSLDLDRHIHIHVVNESGASIYSASESARREFPDHDITVRGAVSIGRRLLDPLAELVKIDPQSIGVGQYQHDVNQKRLKESLDMTVASCVNTVGVNANTASAELLTYVSGIGPTLAHAIVAYRNTNGEFISREDLKKVPRLGAKAFEQCAGFMRIPGSPQPLDNTAVHPESYDIVKRMSNNLGVSVDKLIANDSLIDQIKPEQYVDDSRGLPTIIDILSELRRPGRDPRSETSGIDFAPDVKTIEDITPGMILHGVVNNITAFGAFVDIGIKQSGLIHISQMADHYISSPSEVVSIGRHITARVIDVDLQRGRISLSLKSKP